uniref:Bet v I/Major latex protein domain-containing protein n=1 Tax=Phaseolus vulgaris TaxID=3885 RepID=V7BSD5_PHAVU|nr:hypothetical protein PHAVU_005G021600g [Phaseolus vulgaris]ESW20869.1 hypothetical protein PHAVU_005G021600g [Phaseolus vulgaris]
MAYSQLQKIETKIHIKASAKQFYDVFCNRPHHIANMSPQKVKSIQIHKGEWGTEGSIISWNYTHEGDLLEHYKSFKFNLQVTPKKNGSVMQFAMEFEKQENHIPDPHNFMQWGVELSKNIDTQLIKEHN